jgi:cell wall-associated NlpC family hydrolase
LRKTRFVPGVIVVTTLLFISTAVAPAFASRITDKQAEAAAIQVQVESLNNKVEIAAESYNEAGVRLDSVNKRVARNTARLRSIERRLAQVERRLNTRVISMYEDGPLGFLEVLAGSDSFDQFATNWDLLTRMSEDDAGMIKSGRNLRSQAKATRAVLREDQAAARRQVRIRKEQRIAISAQLSKRRQVLAGVKSEIKTLIAEQAARQAAAAAAAGRAEAARLASGGGGGDSGNYPTPTIPAHGSVVDFAMSRIGLPYVWAAAGPDSFDCSGLVVWSYAKVGISLPHSSRDLINVGQRVSKADLKPGDLVFFGSPIHHVGIYIGGGQMVEAPYTGASVRVRGISRGDYAGASRP